MSKHRANVPKWDGTEATARFLADLAILNAVEHHGDGPAHPEDIGYSMMNAIEVGMRMLDPKR